MSDLSKVLLELEGPIRDALAGVTEEQIHQQVVDSGDELERFDLLGLLSPEALVHKLALIGARVALGAIFPS